MVSVQTLSRSGPGILESRPERPRFTIDGGELLESFLAQIGLEVGQEIQKWIPPGRLEAVLLGGGYGRGEGGVLQTPSGERPYNDLEFYVFIRGNTCLSERRWASVLHEQTERLSARAGVHVEFKILSLAKLRRSPVSMFYYDLMSGHRCIVGEEPLFSECAHHTRANQIPLAEATRLLMNRFSGILFAREELREESFTRESHDFIVRNLAKAKLALGDAVLTVYGQYHWSCRERRRRLQELVADSPPGRGAGVGLEGRALVRSTANQPSELPEPIPHFETIRQFHAQGAEFKLHPRYTEDLWSGLYDQYAEILEAGRDLWLWLESRRLRRTFESIRDYAFDRSNKCPETRAWRNRLVNAKLFGPAFLLQGRASRHPRERLLNSLPVLLWEPEALEQNAYRELLRRELGARSLSQAGVAAAYRELWRRFN